MNKLNKFQFYFVVVIMFPILFSGCKIVSSNIENLSSKGIKIHYIDVGQGDSELIQVNGKNLLIDSGPKESKRQLFKYLNSLKIKKLDYIIATHPHEDHIGNMTDVVNKYSVFNFIAPKITTDTNSFRDMINCLVRKNLKIIPASPLLRLDLGKDVKCEIMSPIQSSYVGLNNYSVVLKITYGKTKFMFMGDSEKTNEKEILENNFDVSCDILKVGHHGSTTATSKEFLNKALPTMAVISCGKGNIYGHPNKGTINNLNEKKIKIFRTDIDGSLIFFSDGNKITKE